MSRQMGTNFKRLVALKASKDAIPSGGGFLDGVKVLSDPDRLAKLFSEAVAFADAAIDAVRKAPGNTYGDDEEAIAGAILAEIDKAAPKATLKVKSVEWGKMIPFPNDNNDSNH